MLFTILILIAAALVIYFSCELFVNSIEWVGRKFNICHSAVGTVLAAFGTALPESVVTFIAVVFGTTEAQKDIGVGAALGGPLVLGTLAYSVVGLGILLYLRKNKDLTLSDLAIDKKKLSRDQLWFLLIFLFKMALGFVIFAAKPWTGLLFVIAYAIYCYKEIGAGQEDGEEELCPLMFCPNDDCPSTFKTLLQTFIALFFIFAGSHVFVDQLAVISDQLGFAPHFVSLLLSPVATELPEILNALIWIRQGKIMLALGNVSGAMMIQATIPSALGIFFTPWLFDSYLALAGAITILSISYLWLTLRKNTFSARQLATAGLFYGAFAGGVVLLSITK